MRAKASVPGYAAENAGHIRRVVIRIRVPVLNSCRRSVARWVRRGRCRQRRGGAARGRTQVMLEQYGRSRLVRIVCDLVRSANTDFDTCVTGIRDRRTEGGGCTFLVGFDPMPAWPKHCSTNGTGS